ncbi:glutamine synthetase nodule isozyme-like [Neltuma alba]|uniref:glutamine synthetase nodule isozyme-like n=1 Tax=Neltuma alba TaxID=207710 RepID=UPI0010A500B9|nr:glutamine synthetase nodule isozyme-like [Prosopis alba]
MALLGLSDNSPEINALYIWIGERGFSGGLQSKARTLPAGPVSSPSNLPRWDHPSGLTLHPQAVFNGPFKGADLLVICDAYTPNGEPFNTNKRRDAALIYSHSYVAAQYPWVVIQQEYALVPLDSQSPASQGQYYPDAGAVNDIVREHYSASLSAGIDIRGTNGRMPDNCKFQVGKWGSADGIFVVDQLCAAHFILKVMAESHRMLVSFEPNAILQTTSKEADTPIWLSTLSMRKFGGYEDSQFKVLKLMMKHMDDIAAREEGNGLEGIRVLRTVLQVFSNL